MMFMQPVNPHGLSPSLGADADVCLTKIASSTAGYTARLLDATARVLQQMIVDAQRKQQGAVAQTLQNRIDAVRGLSILASANAALMTSDVMSEAQIAQTCGAVSQALTEGPDWGADTRELRNVLYPEERKKAIGGVLIASGVMIFTAAALITYMHVKRPR